jgi:hypothetical protein
MGSNFNSLIKLSGWNTTVESNNSTTSVRNRYNTKIRSQTIGITRRFEREDYEYYTSFKKPLQVATNGEQEKSLGFNNNRILRDLRNNKKNKRRRNEKNTSS